jgi:hypothetical protein
MLNILMCGSKSIFHKCLKWHYFPNIFNAKKLPIPIFTHVLKLEDIVVPLAQFTQAHLQTFKKKYHKQRAKAVDLSFSNPWHNFTSDIPAPIAEEPAEPTTHTHSIWIFNIQFQIIFIVYKSSAAPRTPTMIVLIAVWGRRALENLTHYQLRSAVTQLPISKTKRSRPICNPVDCSNRTQRNSKSVATFCLSRF